MNPDGAEYDIATGATSCGARTAAQPGLAGGRYGPQPHWDWQWGCCAARAARSRLRPTAVPRPSRTRPSACGTSSTRASSTARSRSRPRSTSTRTPSSSCGRTAHDGGHRSRLTLDDRNALAALGTNMAATNGYTPSRPATSTSPTARSTTGCGSRHKIFGYTFEMYPRLEPRLLPVRRGHPGADFTQPEAVLQLLSTPTARTGDRQGAAYCAIPSST